MSGFEVHINSIGPNDFAEKREDEKIIPNLISKNLYLNNLQKSWYPVSDAINNILDKKQKEWDNSKWKWVSSINNRLNWTLKFDWNIFKRQDKFKSIKQWKWLTDRDIVEFSLNEVKNEMKNIFLDKQVQKLAFLNEKIYWKK